MTEKIKDKLNTLIDLPVYQYGYKEKQAILESVLGNLTSHHRLQCNPYKNLLNGWMNDNNSSKVINILPLAVRHFKEHTLTSITDDEVYKELHSSGTTGSPSTIILDAHTAKLQSKILIKTLQHWLGKARRPMLIIDSESTIKAKGSITARAAGIRGFSMFGRDHCYALNNDLTLNIEKILDFFKQHNKQPILLFGFTYILWQKFIKPLSEQKLFFDLSQAIVFHGGGWKKMIEQAVPNHEFKKQIKQCLGNNVAIHDYYGMVEQTGTIHIECEQGFLHPPVWADILIRSPIDLSLMPNNRIGLIQVNSMLAYSYPGHCLLTEDLGKIIGEDDCTCGRKGKYFIVQGRVPKAQVRGCSDTFT